MQKATETCRAILQLPINILLDCIKLVFFIYVSVLLGHGFTLLIVFLYADSGLR